MRARGAPQTPQTPRAGNDFFLLYFSRCFRKRIPGCRLENLSFFFFFSCLGSCACFVPYGSECFRDPGVRPVAKQGYDVYVLWKGMCRSPMHSPVFFSHSASRATRFLWTATQSVDHRLGWKILGRYLI